MAPVLHRRLYAGAVSDLFEDFASSTRGARVSGGHPFRPTEQGFMSCETEPVRGPTGLEMRKDRVSSLSFLIYSVHERIRTSDLPLRSNTHSLMDDVES